MPSRLYMAKLNIGIWSCNMAIFLRPTHFELNMAITYLRVYTCLRCHLSTGVNLSRVTGLTGVTYLGTLTCLAACHWLTYHLLAITWHSRLSSLTQNQQNCCRPTCRCHHLGYSVPPALHRTIWCRSTFGPRGPGLSNPTSFQRPALPMAPIRDDNARDKRSVLRPNPATFLRDFALYMTTNYAILWKRCLNYTARITLSTPMTPFGVIGF